MEFKDQYYAIVGQTQGFSRFDGSAMTTITMWGLDDRKTYTTYVVNNYKNSVMWSYITKNPNMGFLVKFPHGKLSKELQIDADSMPSIQDQLASTFELKQVCQRIWDEQAPNKNRRVKPTQQEVLAQAEKFVEMARELFDTGE